MSVIVAISIPTREFPLGRGLGLHTGTQIAIERTVPLGKKTVLFIRVFDEHEQFEATVRERDEISNVHAVSSNGDEVLYALDWDGSEDELFQGIRRSGGAVLRSRGTEGVWQFELRFGSHDALTEFQEYCRDANLPIEIERLYNPTKPDTGPWFGLTSPQRTALTRAVAMGYYDIPRRISTKALAEEFDITDQAMSERLRRAITNLVSNTLLVTEGMANP